MQVLHILNKKTPTSVGVKLCKSVYIFSWATVPVYIYTGTVARLSLKKIILSVRYKNFIFALFFSLSSHWAHQRLSQVSASLSLLSSFSHIYSLKLFLILITTGNNNVRQCSRWCKGQCSFPMWLYQRRVSGSHVWVHNSFRGYILDDGTEVLCQSDHVSVVAEV